MKHIIVEGPDGAGKTTLINHLSEVLELSIHAKASTSVEGPVKNLFDWVNKDMSSLWGPDGGPVSVIYDRHPVISEPIYGRIVRGNVQYPFEEESFISTISQAICDSAVVVWCLTDLDTVTRNVFANAPDQMPGVTAKIAKVHQAYMTAYFRWRGPKRQYDYRRHNRPWFTDELKRMITA